MVAGTLGRMGIVAGMHVAAFYLIARSLGIIPTAPATVPLGTKFVEQRRERDDDPPPRTDPVFERETFTLPLPDVPPVDTTEDTAVVADFVRPDLLTGTDTG